MQHTATSKGGFPTLYLWLDPQQWDIQYWSLKVCAHSCPVVTHVLCCLRTAATNETADIIETMTLSLWRKVLGDTVDGKRVCRIA